MQVNTYLSGTGMTMTGTGTFIAGPGITWNWQGATIAINVDNKGTLTIDGGVYSGLDGVTLTNDGTLNIGDPGSPGSGDLESFNESGTLVNDSGATINMADQTTIELATPVDNKGTINTTGTPRIDNLEPDGAGSITGANLLINTLAVPSSGATLTTSANVTINSAISPVSNGSGTLTVPAGTTVKLEQTTVSSPIDNKGTLTIDGGVYSGLDGVTLTNDGTLNIGDPGSPGSGDLESFNESGTLVNDSGATINMADQTTIELATPVDNKGTINTTGTPRIDNLEPDGAGSITGANLLINTLAVPSSGATLTTSANVTINSAISPVSNGSGTLTVPAGTTVKLEQTTVSSPIDNKGTLTIDGGVYSGLDGVTLTNDGTLNIGDPGSPGSGDLESFNESGTLVNDSGATINMADQTTIELATPVDNKGTINTTGTPRIDNLEPDGAGSITGANLLINTLAVPSSGATLTTSANVTINSAISPVSNGSGTLTVPAGTTVKLEQTTVSSPIDNKGTLTIDGGVYSGLDGVTLTNDGTLNIGDPGSPGSGDLESFNESGTLVNDSGATINMADQTTIELATPVDNKGTINTTGTPRIDNLEPDGAGSVIHVSLDSRGDGSLTVSDPITLAGTLEVSQAAGYSPSVGTKLTVMSAAAITGTFTSLEAPRDDGDAWVPMYGASSVAIEWEQAAPMPPTGVSAVPGDGSAEVSWTGPGDIGGSPISAYTVTASPGGASVTVGAPVTSGDVPGLINGTAYTFTVTATNAQGTSPPSNPSAAVTPEPPVPSATSPAPTISGTATVGQTLTESHGGWSNNPTSYGYQWEDCDSSGSSCSAINGATDQTYTLTASDVGHTIRVRETATNAGGTSTPASSSATAVVAAGANPKATCTAISGTVTLKPGLTNTPAVQTIKIKGTMTGCAGEPFTDVAYKATLTTAGPVSCSDLTGPGERATATGSAKYKWTPKSKPSTATGPLSLVLSEAPSVAFSGENTEGSFSPLTFSGATSESYEGGAKCGLSEGKKKAKAVKKGTFTGTTITFR